MKRAAAPNDRIWAALPGSGQRWASVLAPALLLLLTLAFFWKLAFSGLILARGDTFLYFYPYWDAAAAALRSGAMPLWNPHIFMGAPLLANSQMGFFYPLNWPLWLLLPTPYAVSVAILLHIVLAGIGAFMLARHGLKLSVLAATMAGATFALGGYLTAQVEHVNQLQGLAWMPWLLWLLGHNEVAEDRRLLRRGLWAVLIVALQLLAGHTQSLFISLVALLIYRVAAVLAATPARSWRDRERRRAPLSKLAATAATMTLVAIAGAALAAIQLLPTVELMQWSGREGGLPLNEAVSFSLHPLALAQALLPGGRAGQFTEYIAYLPLTLLLLAIVAAWQWRRYPAAAPPLALLLSGPFLALGRFNPLYLLLAQLPGFSFFRAPARWLALYALGAALLVAIGLDLARGVRLNNFSAMSRRSQRWAFALGAGLILVAFVSAVTARHVPLGAEAMVAIPTLLQLTGWLIELFTAGWLLSRLPRAGPRWRQPMLAAICLLALTVMFLSSRALPFNRLSTAEAYSGLRPPVARLQALGNCRLLPDMCDQQPFRLLSLSDIFFDPGDLAELGTIYAGSLSDEAFYDYVIAIKQKEIIAPNLPMSFGLASVDGFDGGVLPLRHYSAVTSLILPPGAVSSDGRLREYLVGFPEDRWLDLFGARYVITDKVGDEWRQGVFFDTQHTQEAAAGQAVAAGFLPDYEATELWVLGAAAGVSGRFASIAGEQWELAAEQVDEELWRFRLPEPSALAALTLVHAAEPWLLRGLALVDSRDGTFVSLAAGNYRLIYSGDVKIYENLDVLPRAFAVSSWQVADSTEAVLQAMAYEEFDPAVQAVVSGESSGEGGPGTGEAQASIVRYAAEEVVVEVQSDGPVLLVLTDAFYPGWRATIDGEPAAIERVNGLFRGLFVPAGSYVVRFAFEPQSYVVGRWTTLLAGAGIAALALYSSRRSTRAAREIDE